MRKRRWIAVGICVFAIVLLAYGVYWFVLRADPSAPSDEQLASFVSRGADPETVSREIGCKCKLYERDRPSWTSLQDFLGREPASTLGPLRDAVGKYPTIMFHTTMWQMTWIFFDEKGVAREYYTTSQ